MDCTAGQYIECFFDVLGSNRRDLDGATFNGTVTIMRCISFCSKKGYNYAGIQSGYIKIIIIY